MNILLIYYRFYIYFLQLLMFGKDLEYGKNNCYYYTEDQLLFTTIVSDRLMMK